MTNEHPLAFVSYARSDAAHDQTIVGMAQRLRDEVRAIRGEDDFDIFLDQSDIRWGQRWRERIDAGLQNSTFLIPFVTPRYFRRPECRKEYQRFLTVEAERNRRDLILPVYFITAPQIEAASAAEDPSGPDDIAVDICDRQYRDWREHRFEDLSSASVRRAIAELARDVLHAMNRAPGVHAARPNAGAILTELQQGANWVVKPNSRGYYSSIQQAVLDSQPGDVITIHEGEYWEEVSIDKPVTLVGAGRRQATVIRSTSGIALRVEATGGSAENITIDGASPSQTAVLLRTQRYLLRRCAIIGRGPWAVEIASGYAGELSECECIGPSQYGLHAMERAELTVKDSIISGHGLAGIVAPLGSRLIAHRNRITGNGWGIWFYDRPYRELVENDLSGNQFAEINERHSD